MKTFHKVYRICYVSKMADLFVNDYCLQGKEVLDGVFARDFLHEKEIPFTYNGKRYMRMYLWEPQGGVTKIKIGYMADSKFVGAIVYVSYNGKRYNPYVVILDADHVFKDYDIVADMVARGLSWAFKDSGVELKLEPWIPAEGEKMMWGFDCVEAHDLGGDSSLAHELENKKSLIHNCVIAKECEDEILGLLHKYIDGKKRPKAVMRPVHAAIVAGTIHDLTLQLFGLEFGPVMDNKASSFSKYTNMYRHDFQDDKMHDRMVSEFAEIIAKHKK